MAERTIAIVPAAGIGTRLRPHTHTQPKVLLHVAGKPIIAHILDDLPSLGIKEAVLVVGYMGDLVRDYVVRNYPQLKTHFVEQPERLGLGHAVSLAAAHVDDQPVLIILGDTIFEADLRGVLAGPTHSIGVKAVTDPRRFGIVETDRSGKVTLLIEKPERPASNLAITGIYYFTHAAPLLAALDEIQRKNIRTKGEFQLTDAMELMVQKGQVLTTFPVAGWYDCGKTETLLETNRVLLGLKLGARAIDGSVIHSPVAIAATAVVENCILGPHVSVAAGARLKNAIIRDAIINENATVEDILIEASVVGENAVVRGAFKRLNVGDSSEVNIT